MDEEKTFKEKVLEKKDQAKVWCRAHIGELVTIFGGICTVTGAIINYASKKYEEDSYVYTMTRSGDIKKIKCKSVETVDIDCE